MAEMSDDDRTLKIVMQGYIFAVLADALISQNPFYAKLFGTKLTTVLIFAQIFSKPVNDFLLELEKLFEAGEEKDKQKIPALKEVRATALNIRSMGFMIASELITASLLTFKKITHEDIDDESKVRLPFRAIATDQPWIWNDFCQKTTIKLHILCGYIYDGLDRGLKLSPELIQKIQDVTRIITQQALKK
jgi:hypothetical protein